MHYLCITSDITEAFQETVVCYLVMKRCDNTTLSNEK